MPSSYQVVLWKQERFVVLRPLQIEFFRNLLGINGAEPMATGYVISQDNLRISYQGNALLP
jgi:hypothetical protein